MIPIITGISITLTVTINAPATVTTHSTTGFGTASANVTGGSGPYFYSWSMVGPNAHVNSPSSQTTTFSGTASTGGTTQTLYITVIDSRGSQATNNFAMTFTQTTAGGGSP